MNNKILMAASYWPHDRKRQPMGFCFYSWRGEARRIAANIAKMHFS